MFVDPAANYLLDTNVISEYRKGERAHPGVKAFFDSVDTDRLFLPVQVLGEIQAGIVNAARNNDHGRVRVYSDWLEDVIREYGDRIIDFDLPAARTWGFLLLGGKKDPHTVDKQIAAIAILRGMVVVTGAKGEAFSKPGALTVLNPFEHVPGGPGAT